jgi:hypothetical protein
VPTAASLRRWNEKALMLHDLCRSTSHRACTKQFFNWIGQGKQTFTEKDVRAFARKANLPLDYVKPFYTGLQQLSGTRRLGVNYETFHRYVSARERALKRIFDTLDAGGHFF